jgi:predicted ribosome quality control (RQC) complex YloA/Tae2 family protein
MKRSEMKREIFIIDEKEYQLLIGQNAKENEDIIKMSNQNDLWFHFENISGPHIILQSNGDLIPKRYLYQIAIKLFEHKPKAPKNQNVIYTEIKNIKLTNTLGTVNTKCTKLLKF